MALILLCLFISLERYSSIKIYFAIVAADFLKIFSLIVCFGCVLESVPRMSDFS